MEMESCESYYIRNPKSDITNRLFNFPVSSTTPNLITSRISTQTTYVLVALSFGFGAILAFWPEKIAEDAIVLILFVIFGLGILTCVFIISRQPQSKLPLPFKVTPVPLLPAVCLVFNVYLMLKLNYLTWIRFTVWLGLGLAMYFGYGMWNSKEKLKTTVKNKPMHCELH